MSGKRNTNETELSITKRLRAVRKTSKSKQVQTLNFSDEILSKEKNYLIPSFTINGNLTPQYFEPRYPIAEDVKYVILNMVKNLKSENYEESKIIARISELTKLSENVIESILAQVR